MDRRQHLDESISAEVRILGGALSLRSGSRLKQRLLDDSQQYCQRWLRNRRERRTLSQRGQCHSASERHARRQHPLPRARRSVPGFSRVWLQVGSAASHLLQGREEIARKSNTKASLPVPAMLSTAVLPW